MSKAEPPGAIVRAGASQQQVDAGKQHEMEGRNKEKEGSAQLAHAQFAEAATWYRKASDAGFARGQTSLGLLYDYGKGVEKDELRALKLFRLASTQGDAEAIFLIGLRQYEGTGGRGYTIRMLMFPSCHHFSINININIIRTIRTIRTIIYYF